MLRQWAQELRWSGMPVMQALVCISRQDRAMIASMAATA
jgi:hypothetical protein